MQDLPFDQAIWNALSAIPRGRVASYGGLARMAGWPNYARQAGSVLKKLPSNTQLPWHRVIKSSGHLAFPEGSESHKEQRQRLEKEGVGFVGNRVDINKFSCEF